MLEKLYAVYAGEDATLVEVNPLVLTAEGDIVALDGKVTLDANATSATRTTRSWRTRHPPTRSRPRPRPRTSTT